MYCINCGNRIENKNDKFCVNCGIKLDGVIDGDTDGDNYSNNLDKKSNWMKITSIVLGGGSIVGTLLIIFAPIAFILSIVGLIIGFISLKKGKNIPGILLNSIGLVLSLIVNVILVFVIVSLIGDVGYKSIDWVSDFYNDHGYYPYGEHRGEDF